MLLYELIYQLNIYFNLIYLLSNFIDKKKDCKNVDLIKHLAFNYTVHLTFESSVEFKLKAI